MDKIAHNLTLLKVKLYLACRPTIDEEAMFDVAKINHNSC